MNAFLIIANILTVLAFFVHTFVGDKELKQLEPSQIDSEENFILREKWTMTRCAWHWVSIDLLLASVAYTLINLSKFFNSEKSILQILTVFFFSYAIVWIISLIISRPFPKNYIKLGQWILLLLIGILSYLGM